MSNSPVFSPTQTMDWLRDPLAWYIRHVEGWQPRYIGKKQIAGVLGSAFAEGTASYHNWLRSPSPSRYGGEKEAVIKRAAQAAVDRVKSEKSRILTLGQTVYEDQSEAWNLLEERAAKAIFKYAECDPLPAGYRILDVELTLPNHGNARLDLALEGPLGIMVVDLKTKLTLDLKYQPQTLREYEYSWQMLHYSWAYAEYLGRPVTQFAILLFILEPKSRLPVFHPVAIDPEIMQMWVQSARQVWRLMEAMKTGTPVQMDGTPWSTFQFFSRFGREDWADAITKHRLDENLLSKDYVRTK